MPSDWWPSSSAGSLTGLACELFSNPWAASSLQSSDLDLAPALYSPHPQPHYHHKQQHVPSVVYHRFCLPTFGSRSSAYWLDSSGRRCLCLYIHASRQATHVPALKKLTFGTSLMQSTSSIVFKCLYNNFFKVVDQKSSLGEFWCHRVPHLPCPHHAHWESQADSHTDRRQTIK